MQKTGNLLNESKGQRMKCAACNAIMQMSGVIITDFKEHVLEKHGLEFKTRWNWNKRQPTKF